MKGLNVIMIFIVFTCMGCALEVPHVDAADDCCAEIGAHLAEADDCCAIEADSDELVGGIPVPPGVRENLGITFAKAERRAVNRTRRVPGQFELLPASRQEYRAVVSGTVTLHVAPFEPVEPGDLLFSLDSPQWRQIQHEAVEAEGDIAMAQAAIEVARARRAEASDALKHQETRVQNLAAANMRKADLEAELAATRASLPRLDADIRLQEAALREAREHYESRLKILASVSGIPREMLYEKNGGESIWRTISHLEILAKHRGVTEEIRVSNGGWLDNGELAMTTIDPTAIRFHAEAPQSEALHYRDGQASLIVPPQGGSIPLQDAMRGPLTLGLTAHPETRTISLYVTPATIAPWARAGIAGFLEVTLSGDDREHWSIPRSALIQDGLDHIFFRRDPKDPNRVFRVVADMGESDGRWVALRSGVMEGDEVVLDGAYALNLTGATAQAPPGYHYHADGTLHKDH